jgi:hypothetical protein
MENYFTYVSMAKFFTRTTTPEKFKLTQKRPHVMQNQVSDNGMAPIG